MAPAPGVVRFHSDHDLFFQAGHRLALPARLPALPSALAKKKMQPSTDRLRFGYWPSRQLSGEIPLAIRSPDEYSGADVLNIACTQTGLPTSQQRRIVDEWTRLLPTVPATMVIFSSKVSQALFDAACAVPHLRAQSIAWSSCQSVDQLKVVF